MPGNIVQKESERRVFGKVFVSGLKQVSLSSRTVGSFHETHHCSTGFILPLVCLFLPTVHPASPSFARVFFSLFSPSLSLFLSLPLSFFFFPSNSLPRPLPPSYFSLPFSFSLSLRVSPVPSTNLLPNGVPYGRSPSACLPERSMLRFGRRSWFSMAWLGAFLIIGRVLPSPEEIPRVSTICPATAPEPSRTEISPQRARWFHSFSREPPGSDCSRARAGYEISSWICEIDCRLYNHCYARRKKKNHANQFERNVRSIIAPINWHSKISSRIWIKHYSNLFEINWEIIFPIYIAIL